MDPAIPPPRVTDGMLRRRTTEVLSAVTLRAKPLVGGLSVGCRGEAPTRRCALHAAALGHLPLCPRIGEHRLHLGLAGTCRAHCYLGIVYLGIVARLCQRFRRLSVPPNSVVK